MDASDCLLCFHRKRKHTANARRESEMTSTVSRGGGQVDRVRNGSLSQGEDGDSSASSIPPYLDLSVVLPAGSLYRLTVDSQMPMMDLLVKVAASNKLSPSSHSLQVYSEDGRPVQYHPSHTVYSVGQTTLHLVSKKQESRRPPVPANGKPFEVTHRLTVNLPRNQKWVTRVNHKSTLADIFKMICSEKNLDPYKYELRHPTKPDQALNMASPLDSYSINEIYVVPVNAGNEQDKLSSHSLDRIDHYEVEQQGARMPRRKASKEAELPQGYMPGMEAEGKKKRSFFGFLSRGKSSSFKLDEESTSAKSNPENAMSYNDTSGKVKQGVVVRSRSPDAPHPAQNHVTQPELRHKAPQVSSTHTASRVSSNSLHSHSSNASDKANSGPSRPPRKKRQAPPPPPGTGKPPAPEPAPSPPQPVQSPPQPVQAPLSVRITNKENAHSRTSSHSSGFDESSPLESPGNSSRESTKTSKTKTSIDATSIESSEQDHVTVTRSTVIKKEAVITEETPPNGTLTRPDRKKRKAPPPPPGGSSPPAALPGPQARKADEMEMKSAVVAELKQESGVQAQQAEIESRPKPQFIAPPPPDSPPPPMSPTPCADETPPMVADSSIQVHVSSRSGRIESQTSEVSIDEVHNGAVIDQAPSPQEMKGRFYLGDLSPASPALERSYGTGSTGTKLMMQLPGKQHVVVLSLEGKESKAAAAGRMEGHESDSDASDTSSVMAYDVSTTADDKLEDEVAIPGTDDSVILTSKRSIDEGPVDIKTPSPEVKSAQMMHQHSTPIHQQLGHPPNMDMYPAEISFDNIDVIYVNPDEDKTTHTKTDESSTDPFESSMDPVDSSVDTNEAQKQLIREDSFYTEDNSPKHLSDDHQPVLVSDYRVTHLERDEVVDFKFGGNANQSYMPPKTPQKTDNKPVVTSLRQAYRRSYPLRADDAVTGSLSPERREKRDSELFNIIRRDSNKREERPFVAVQHEEVSEVKTVHSPSSLAPVSPPLSVSSPPPPIASQPPPMATSPPPMATSPPPMATSPPPMATSPPPMATSPPPMASSPPSMASSPPTMASPPPPVASLPPPIASPPPTMASPPPVSPVLGTPQHSSSSLHISTAAPNSLGPPSQPSPPPESQTYASTTHNVNISNNNQNSDPQYADHVTVSADKVWEIIEEKKTSPTAAQPEPTSPPLETYSVRGSSTLPRSNTDAGVERSTFTKKGMIAAPRAWNMSRAKSEHSVNEDTTESKVRQETRRLSALIGPQGYNRQRQDFSFAHPVETENEAVLEEKSISFLNSPPRARVAHNSGDAEDKEKLQKQYDDLQKQFYQWEQQLMQNQALISKKVTPKPETVKTQDTSIPLSPPPPPMGYVPPPPPVSQVTIAPRKPDARYEPPKKPDARYERPKSTSSLSYSTGGLAGKFSSDELLSAKANLRRSESEFDPGPPDSPPMNNKPENTINNNTLYNVEPREGSPGSVSSAYKRRTIGTANPATQPPVKSAAPRSNKRFEIQMDPREELMIAIRNAGGRGVLRKVPVNKTKWYYNGAQN